MRKTIIFKIRKTVITLRNICAVHWGCALQWGCSVHWGDIMSTVGGDTMSTPGDVQYTGGLP